MRPGLPLPRGCVKDRGLRGFSKHLQRAVCLRLHLRDEIDIVVVRRTIDHDYFILLRLQVLCEGR